MKKIGARHPLQKSLELVVWTPEQYNEIEKENASMAEHLAEGVVLWGSTW